MNENKFSELVKIVKKVRRECPWDKEQTHDSIKANTIEEAFEVAESIDNKDYNELKIELGDVLLHVIFHAQIAEDNNTFNLDDVITEISNKLVRRHPHVFGNLEVSGTEEVLRNWEQIKLQEGRKSVIGCVPSALPSLQRAYRLQEKASKIGFDWQHKKDVWAKVEEEIEEFKRAEHFEDEVEKEKEFGDILFSLVNYARFNKIDPESALRRTNDKFTKRFQYMENKILESGRKLKDCTLEEMDKYWEESKTKL
ncbi:MAG: nucleoside triphosphate pyrophosphohydrolase [Bacteroidota bacterium]|nr:nucleoside triphosphate pyrophosphohydrolase [Bacteroidota bacterium]